MLLNGIFWTYLQRFPSQLGIFIASALGSQCILELTANTLPQGLDLPWKATQSIPKNQATLLSVQKREALRHALVSPYLCLQAQWYTRSPAGI